MKCSKCLKEKPDSERSCKSNRQCKECYNKYRNEYYHNNPEYRQQIAKQSKENRRNLRIEVMSYYSEGTPKCNCCGETTYEFLSIDHINGGGAEHRKRGIESKALYRWLRTNNYPKEYQVLCMNCNFAKGQYGCCPHNKKEAAPLEAAL